MEVIRDHKASNIETAFLSYLKTQKKIGLQYSRSMKFENLKKSLAGLYYLNSGDMLAVTS
jgi:hypothetical protein